jgi:uncharacterized lipoprotein YajG
MKINESGLGNLSAFFLSGAGQSPDFCLSLGPHLFYGGVMKNTLSSILVVATLFGLVGCATGQMALAPAEMEPFPAAADRTPVRTSLSFQIHSSEDQRNIGAHQLGWSGTTPDNRRAVVTERTVAETLADRLKAELNSRGFQSRVGGEVAMGLTIQKFDIQSVPNGPFHTPSCSAEVTVDLTRAGSKRSAKVKLNSNFTAPAPLFKTQLANAQTVASCMNLITEGLVKNTEFQQMLAQ